MSPAVSTAFPADGFDASWADVGAGRTEHLSLRWDNEAWTAAVTLDLEQVEFVVRLSPLWQVRQLLLFRDLKQPDLWLGTDGRGHWGEINGVHRPELEGATDIAVVRDGAWLSAFVHAIPVRRASVEVGGSFDTRVLEIDVETLGVEPVPRTYRRVDPASWEVVHAGVVTRVVVDDYGLPTEVSGSFVRRS